MRLSFGLLICGAIALFLSGCLVPAVDYNACQVQNRSLIEQNRALQAEAANGTARVREVENRLADAEKQLAAIQDRAGADRRQLELYRREREELYSQFNAAAYGRGRLPADVARQLTDLSRRYPNLQFDAESGVGKFDTDVLFDAGDATLKRDAAVLIDDLARVLKSPAAENTKIMIAGHTDNQAADGRLSERQRDDDFHLSAARALAVADRMKRAGLPEQRIAVAGFGAHQPIAGNVSASERQMNRRVEIFVMAPGTPVVGWTESTPTVYSASRSNEQRQ